MFFLGVCYRGVCGISFLFIERIFFLVFVPSFRLSSFVHIFFLVFCQGGKVRARIGYARVMIQKKKAIILFRCLYFLKHFVKRIVILQSMWEGPFFFCCDDFFFVLHPGERRRPTQKIRRIGVEGRICLQKVITPPPHPSLAPFVFALTRTSFFSSSLCFFLSLSISRLFFWSPLALFLLLPLSFSLYFCTRSLFSFPLSTYTSPLLFEKERDAFVASPTTPPPRPPFCPRYPPLPSGPCSACSSSICAAENAAKADLCRRASSLVACEDDPW